MWSTLQHTQPVGIVMEDCLPDPVGSFSAAMVLSVALMTMIAALVWILAAIPEAASRMPLQHLGSRLSASSPLLHGSARRLDVLDGLRTVLVLYIVIYHVRWALPPMLAPWFSQGHWAVQFFFVLSGFVAAISARDQNIGMDAARTMTVRRLTRLCPAYFLALLGVAAVAYCRGGGEPFLAWPLQALMLQSLMPVKICGAVDAGHWSQNFLPYSANGTGWFVSAIVIVSLCFPLLHNARPRGGFKFTLATLVLVIAARAVPTLLTIEGWCPFDAYVFAPVRLLEFAAGMLSAQLYKEMPNAAVEFQGWDWIFDASLCAAAVPIWFLGHWHSWATVEGSHGDFFLTGIFCLTCVAARGMAEPQHKAAESEEKMGSPLAALLSSSVLVKPALYSYQAYVYQEIFISVLGIQTPATIARFWWLPVPLTWAAAVVSVHLLEEPLKQCVEARLATARGALLAK